MLVLLANVAASLALTVSSSCSISMVGSRSVCEPYTAGVKCVMSKLCNVITYRRVREVRGC